MLLLVALLAALPRAYAQGTQPIVREIRVSGNLRVESGGILSHVGQKVGQPLDLNQVTQDQIAIFKMGFFRGVDSRFDRTTGVLTFVVQENPVVSDIRIEGMKAMRPNDDKVIAAVKLHQNEIFSATKAQETINELTELYQDKSYLDVKITQTSVQQAGNSEVVVFNVNEGPKVEVTQIDFVGNKEIPSYQLKSVMDTHTYSWLLSWLTGAGALDRKKLQDDVDHIQAFYYDKGFLNVRVAQPDISRTGNNLKLTFNIDEGPRYKVGRVAIAGNLKFPRHELVKLLTIRRGQDFDGGALEHNLLSVSEFYENRGYAYVNVDPRTRTDPTAKTVDITFYVTPGQEVLVNRINIAGNTKTSDKVIRRELQIQEQEPYDAEEIRESKERLDRLGFFTETRITTEPAGSPDKINLTVDVAEANTASLQVAGGFDSYSSVFGNFTLGNTNLFGGGEAIVLNAQVGFLFQNYSITYTEPWFLDIPLSVQLQAFDNKTFLLSFNQSAAGFAINTNYPLTELGFKKLGPFSLKDVSAGLGYQFESVGITGLNPLTTFQILRYKGYTQTSELLPSIRRFTVDNPIDPRSGTVLSLNGQIGGLGGTNSFVKGTAHARYFYTFLKSPALGSWVLSQGVTFGIGTNLGGGSAGELPLYERFFPGGVGGAADVRGYQLYSLGPTVTLFNAAGSPISVQDIGGSKMLIFSNEITFPILSALGLRGVIFADAGQSFTLHDSLDISKLQAAYGIGVRWRSPFGPLSIDVARPINPRPADQNTVFEIGAGAPL